MRLALPLSRAIVFRRSADSPPQPWRLQARSTPEEGNRDVFSVVSVLWNAAV